MSNLTRRKKRMLRIAWQSYISIM